ncbi:MAG: glycosyltransferase family 9 protein, partial [Verrucomicrobia bacterium]|nr:glycosyltransferase family 9 protein [Verrucomicrobiota bacterium]
MRASPQNILVRMPNWIGDLVMATPVLTDLRQAFPKASITAMCRTPLCELLAKDESIDELFCFTRPSNDFLRRHDLRDLIAKIAAGKYDTGVLLTNSFSSAWWFWQGKVQRRIGYSLHFRRFLLTDPLSLPKNEHQVITYKRLLAPLGISLSQTAPRLFLSGEEIAQSKTLLYQRGYIQGTTLIGINPGAAYGSAKCWPPDRFRALALRLL